MSLRIAWNSAAAAAETGSSLMSANAAVGKGAAVRVAVGVGVVRAVAGGR
jgi:hypothetical protein